MDVKHQSFLINELWGLKQVLGHTDSTTYINFKTAYTVLLENGDIKSESDIAHLLMSFYTDNAQTSQELESNFNRLLISNIKELAKDLTKERQNRSSKRTLDLYYSSEDAKITIQQAPIQLANNNENITPFEKSEDLKLSDKSFDDEIKELPSEQNNENYASIGLLINSESEISNKDVEEWFHNKQITEKEMALKLSLIHI